MSEYIVQSDSLQAVANKIREKTGDSAPLEFPDEFVAKIDSMNPPYPLTPDDSLLFYSLNKFSLKTKNSLKNWDGLLEYSTDHSTWTEWDGTEIYAQKTDFYYCLYLKGTNNTYITNATNSSKSFVFNGIYITCVGNIEKMLNTSSTIAQKCFAYLFYDCTNVGFDITLLPTVTSEIYSYMFYNCKSLTKAPELPALSLSPSCYNYMFEGCSYLETAPTLPATTLATNCYQGMFKDCISLVDPPVLPALIAPNGCYNLMFSGCTSLENAPALPATTIGMGCYSYMFERTKIKTAPALPSQTVFMYCYQYMFRNCQQLETIPELPATELKGLCYYDMFSGCSKIKISTTQTGEYQTEYRIPSSGTGTDASSSMTDMFASTGGTFTGTPTINTTYYTSNTIVPAT